MTGGYPDFETYRTLYLRYHSGRDAGELLGLLGPLGGIRLLDLCCGEGQLSLGALAAGAAAVVAVDAEPAMVGPALHAHPRAHVMTDDVRDALGHLWARGARFDRIACRQAVNYWLDERTAELAAAVLASRGVFAFNTFNREPPEKPRVLQYEREGHAFVEVSWLVGDTVHHLQARDGMAPHCTSFTWLPSERLREILGPYFAIQEERDGNTSLYRCEKKG